MWSQDGSLVLTSEVGDFTGIVGRVITTTTEDCRRPRHPLSHIENKILETTTYLWTLSNPRNIYLPEMIYSGLYGRHSIDCSLIAGQMGLRHFQ